VSAPFLVEELAFAAYNNVPPGLEAVSYYDPPNMTYPFGAMSASSTSMSTPG